MTARLPLRPATSARDLGATAVLALRPDAEPLGCGGVLALLATAGAPARLVVVCDGPGGREACEADTRAALDALGLDPDAAAFLGLPDGGLPEEGTRDFARAAVRLADALHGVETVIVPWRRAADPDHAATWALACAAATRLDDPPRWLEYLGPDADPDAVDDEAWRLDIRPVLDRKRRALAGHLPPGAPDRPWELFVEAPRPWLHRERVF